MAIYVYDKASDRMVDKATGALMNAPDAPLATPMVRGDTPGYASPIDGSWIDGRRARKYDMEKNNCIDANELSTGPRKLKNEKFAKKWGVEHLLESK